MVTPVRAILPRTVGHLLLWLFTSIRKILFRVILLKLLVMISPILLTVKHLLRLGLALPVIRWSLAVSVRGCFSVVVPWWRAITLLPGTRPPKTLCLGAK